MKLVSLQCKNANPKLLFQGEENKLVLQTSAEREETILVEICMIGAGAFMPPIFIFPRQRYNSEFMQNAPPGSTAVS